MTVIGRSQRVRLDSHLQGGSGHTIGVRLEGDRAEPHPLDCAEIGSAMHDSSAPPELRPAKNSGPFALSQVCGTFYRTTFFI